jgi:hypothetical protein
MPTPADRPSLTKDLASRYATQRAGGAFEVKQRLKPPGASPSAGDRMPIDGNERIYSADDFAVKQAIGVTELLDAQEANTTSSPKSKELSLYIRGFSNRKYKP